MRYIWSTTLLLLTAAGEVASGSRWGLPLPLTCLACFYLAVSQGTQRVLPGAVVATVLLDVQLGRGILPTVLLLPLIFRLADWWRAHGDSGNLFALSVPGGGIGLATATVAWSLVYGLRSGPFGVAASRFLPAGLTATFAGALALPVLAFSCDAIAQRAGFTRIADIRPPRKKAHA